MQQMLKAKAPTVDLLSFEHPNPKRYHEYPCSFDMGGTGYNNSRKPLLIKHFTLKSNTLSFYPQFTLSYHWFPQFSSINLSISCFSETIQIYFFGIVCEKV